MRTLLVVIAGLVGCSTAPVTGRKQLNLVGDSTINQLGMQSYQQEIAKAKIDTDPAHVELVQRVSKRLADTAEAQFHPGYQWQTTVIDDPKTVNAWCMPGGKIAVYSGILPFSRQQESEADHIGLLLMAKAGYNPAKAVDFWQRMLDYSKGKEPPAFLSDHPSSEQRIADIKRELPEARAAFVAHK